MPPTMLAAVGSVQKSTNKSAELIELIRNILQDDIKWLRDSIEVTSRRHLISWWKAFRGGGGAQLVNDGAGGSSWSDGQFAWLAPCGGRPRAICRPPGGLRLASGGRPPGAPVPPSVVGAGNCVSETGADASVLTAFWLVYGTQSYLKLCVRLPAFWND